MDHELREINQRGEQFGSEDKSNSSNSEAATRDEIGDSNAKSKMEGESKCPSHVIDVKCDGLSGENQRVCRICHLNAKESGKNTVELTELGCGCKGELGVAHLHCAEAWFRVRGNRMCEICGETAKNISGVGDIRFMEEWSESQTGETESGPSGGSRRCLSGQPLCNFLMACLVIAFVLPWFFRVNML
ncbi:E3 ubiquitin-protein ligase MARCHF8-like [Salvia divinorum]|uniref:E3 ubiquitin-protein ligase MARCHF8-like n=1 Tax=Salvia divinorum TaxID=28513 RepID=A0ABD1II23_SALDI